MLSVESKVKSTASSPRLASNTRATCEGEVAKPSRIKEVDGGDCEKKVKQWFQFSFNLVSDEDSVACHCTTH